MENDKTTLTSPPLYVRFGSGLVDENGDSVDFLVDTRPFPESVKYTPAVPGSAEQSEDSACVAELEQVLSDLRQGTIKPYALRAVRDAITEIKRARKRATVEKVDLEDRVAEYLLGVSRDDIRIGNAAATVIKLVCEELQKDRNGRLIL